MISYFGAKWRAAPKYPPPKYGTIVEPFAGGAGYSLRYADRDVILVEKEPRLAAMWKWLTTTTKDENVDLPLEITDLREMDLRPEAKTLIGFWVNNGASSSCNKPSAWMRSSSVSSNKYWGNTLRSRISDSVGLISHWTIIAGGYESAPDIEATWFIDPPYQLAGKRYLCGSKAIDFAALGSWCKARRGQVIACENVGADWLPFLPFAKVQSMSSKNRKGTSDEAIWYRETGEP
jgi:hypothetical protein